MYLLVWQMGLTVFKEDPELTEKPKLKVAQRDIKATDLPIEDTDSAKETWNDLVALIIDWAGTTDDPFGTNENPDPIPTIQELWDTLFSDEHHVDVTKYPAIKKIVSHLS